MLRKDTGQVALHFDQDMVEYSAGGSVPYFAMEGFMFGTKSKALKYYYVGLSRCFGVYGVGFGDPYIVCSQMILAEMQTKFINKDYGGATICKQFLSHVFFLQLYSLPGS